MQVFGVAPDAQALVAEAHALHRAVFGGPAPEPLVDLYAAAHRTLWPDGPPEGESVRRALERGLDLEALELAWRIRGRKHPLVQKTQILVCLAEGLPEYQSRLVGAGLRPPSAALLTLFGHGLRTAGKVVKGFYLIRRYHLE